MKAEDRAAVKRVRDATIADFTRRVKLLTKDPRWEPTFRAVRLSCQDCEGGYLVRMYRGTSAAKAHCCECNAEPLDAKAYWVTKCRVVMQIVTGEDLGERWPYFLVEPRSKAS